MLCSKWHANNCLSVNESFRVKCETFQYLVNKIAFFPFCFCLCSSVCSWWIEPVGICSSLAGGQMKHWEKTIWLYVPHLLKRRLLCSIAMTHQHDTCPDGLAMGEKRTSIFISSWLTDFITAEQVSSLPFRTTSNVLIYMTVWIVIRSQHFETPFFNIATFLFLTLIVTCSVYWQVMSNWALACRWWRLDWDTACAHVIPKRKR